MAANEANEPYCWVQRPVHHPQFVPFWIGHSFKFPQIERETRSYSYLYIFMRYFKTRAGRGINTSGKCAHLWTPELPPAWISREVKGSKSLFRWVDLLRPIMLLHCDRLEAERQSGQNKDKGGIKEENRTQLQHLYNLPYLTPEH